MFSRLKIRTTITAGVLSLAALAATALIMGTLGLRQAHGHFSKIDSHTVPTLGAIGALSSDVELLRVRIARKLLNEDVRSFAADTREIVDTIDKVDRQFATYEKLVSDPEERTIFLQAAAQWQRIKELSAPVIDMTAPWPREQARKRYSEDFKTVGIELNSTLKKQLSHGVEIAHQQNVASTEQMATNIRSNLLLAALAAAVTIAIVVILQRRVSRPLEQLRHAMEMMVSGNLDAAIPGEDRSDELDEIARALHGIKSGIAERARRESAAQAAAQQQVTGALGLALAALANGDLRHRVTQTFPADYEQIRIDFNNTVNALERQITEVAGASSAVGAGASEIATASEDLSRRTERQSASLEETAATVNELKGSVMEARQATMAARSTAQETRTEATDSGEMMSRAVQAMAAISQSSEKMRSIIQIIDGISFQTSLLALNAGVEAARAGEAGRGFAVVATEVRSLAERAASAAREISELIETSGKEVHHGVDMVSRTRDSLERIVGKAGDLAVMIESISESAEKQTVSIAQAATAVTEIDRATQQNAALAEETTAASQSLSREAARLTDVVRMFALDGAQARTGPRENPRKAAPSARPSAPARALTHGSAALAMAPDVMEDWTEF